MTGAQILINLRYIQPKNIFIIYIHSNTFIVIKKVTDAS